MDRRPPAGTDRRPPAGTDRRPPAPGRAGWGNVARRGAAGIGDDRPARPDRVSRNPRQGKVAWAPEQWVEDPPKPRRPRAGADKPSPTVRASQRRADRSWAPRTESPGAPTGRPRGRKLPGEVGTELEKVAGAKKAPRLTERLAEATREYDRDRYEDARRILKPLAEEAPAAGAVRELYGLTLYRMGRWREALRQLAAFHELTKSYDQHPTMEDCERALGRHAKVAAVWTELAEASPGAELVNEGRIVMAGSLADQGDLAGAIRLLEAPARRVDRPREHHLRLWYTLADLYERSGDVGKARELFARIVRPDRAFFDAAERLAGVG